MAPLTDPERDELRQMLAGAVTPTWTKPQINAALQAVEDWFETARAGAGAAIEAAAPGVFSPANKRRLLVAWLRQKLRREGSL